MARIFTFWAKTNMGKDKSYKQEETPRQLCRLGIIFTMLAVLTAGSALIYRPARQSDHKMRGGLLAWTGPKTRAISTKVVTALSGTEAEVNAAEAFAIQRFHSASMLTLLGIVALGSTGGFLLGQRNPKAIYRKLNQTEAQKRAEEALLEFKTAVEQSADGMALTDLDGNIRYVNEAWAKMHGYLVDELIGQHLGIFHTGEQLETEVNPFNEKLQATGSNKGEIGHVRKDGITFPTQMTTTLLMDAEQKPFGMLGIARDITAQKRAEEEAQSLKRQIEFIIGATKTGLDIIDVQFNLRYVDSEWARIYGDWKGRKCYEYFMDRDSPCPDCGVVKALCTKQMTVTEERLAKEGNRPVQVTTIPYQDEHGEWLVAEINVDISERKRAEEKMNSALKAAEAANVAKSQFLANMSHEIRTPMNAIIGFSDILAEEKLAERQSEQVNLIRSSGKHLLELINDILDFSKIEAGKLNVEMNDCSLAQMLHSMESMMHSLAKGKGLEFAIRTRGSLPAKVRTDAERLRQCLINLINNAIKFTEKGHVYVNICMEARNNQPYIRFDVEDTGIGIPIEKQEKIFESFTQADGSTSRKYGGTGLGLAITRQLSKLLGGELTLTSEEGKGTVFSLVIPVGLEVTGQPILDRYGLSPNAGEDDATSEEREYSGRVLVAEDVKTNQMLIKLLLQRMGLEVTIAGNGREAVQKALEREYDLIFMDMQMPDMNGYEATRALRQKGITIPIIALTAHALKEDEGKCLAAGCDDYLTKPMDRSQLRGKIGKYLALAAK